MSRCFDSGFQCLGVPMPRGETLLCCLKVELPRNVSTAIPRSNNTAYYGTAVTTRPVP